ncbi:vWA domain-containing protein [Pseudooceanicola marinus]|uniref:vWA domain-containing protein n=1 Tax=Pseudooceanicola marinus TaxID=396013 RepID=UPI001CD4E9A6|nr:VWA domain-containing protein [Pseudooceanicola marinus]MCA1335157.1 VWA domain-containing protein [Pseudooceanicola marinus]
MPRFSLSALLLPVIALPFPATAQTMAPTALVEAFLADHGARVTQGRPPLLNDAEASALYLVDSLAREGLQGRLGFDPVYNAQDIQITGLRVFTDPEAPILQGAAQVWVAFENFGQVQEMAYTLVTTPEHGHWQISDIYSVQSGWSLQDLARRAGVDLTVPMGPERTLQATTAPVLEPAVTPGMEEGDLPAHMGNDIGNGPAAPGGRDLLIILDASGSMWGQIDGVAKMTTAQQALAGLLGDLPATTRLGLMAYGHRREGDCTDTELLAPVGAAAAPQVIGAVEALRPLGKTPISASLDQAARAFGPGEDRARNVLLISDGLETCGGDPCAAAAALAAQGIDTRVHVVGFDLSAEEHAQLQCIAEEGRGSYYAADNAAGFAEALVQATAQVAAPPAPTPTPPPAPAPKPEPPAAPLFEETFDGPALDPAWRIEAEAPERMAFWPEGELYMVAAGKRQRTTDPEATNRLVLDQPLPEGDFDLAVALRLRSQTRHEAAWLSLYQDATNQVGARLMQQVNGCGTQLGLSLIRYAGSAGSKPEATAFDIPLFNDGVVKSTCNEAGRAEADAILAALEDEGATLRLKRRGRAMTAALDLAYDAPGGTRKEIALETEALTLLRAAGQPSLLAAQAAKGAPGESHIIFDRFTIETTRD